MIVLLLLVIAFWGYVEIVNRNSKDMSLRQKILKAVYPVLTGISRLKGKGTTILKNENSSAPPASFYDLSVELNNGDTLSFATLKGKKVLLVNTASDCGYTAQYTDLQKLFESHKENLFVLGFPANDFKEQEKGTDEEIAEFCKVNYGVTFPLVKKSSVRKGYQQHEVFKWLTESKLNGWNNKQPSWNFCKYLVNEQGVLTNYFGASISPLNRDVLTAISR